MKDKPRKVEKKDKLRDDVVIAAEKSLWRNATYRLLNDGVKSKYMKAVIDELEKMIINE